MSHHSITLIILVFITTLASLSITHVASISTLQQLRGKSTEDPQPTDSGGSQAPAASASASLASEDSSSNLYSNLKFMIPLADLGSGMENPFTVIPPPDSSIKPSDPIPGFTSVNWVQGYQVSLSPIPNPLLQQTGVKVYPALV